MRKQDWERIKQGRFWYEEIDERYWPWWVKPLKISLGLLLLALILCHEAIANIIVG